MGELFKCEMLAPCILFVPCRLFPLSEKKDKGEKRLRNLAARLSMENLCFPTYIGDAGATMLYTFNSHNLATPPASFVESTLDD